MDYCGNCGTSFGAVEETTEEPATWSFLSESHYDDRGRISLLLYLGSAMIALSGLLSAYAVASLHGGLLPPSFTDYSWSVLAIGIAFVLVGFARQAKRMRE
jgi:4-amino-4-deoxy-L-arabinose transferase-like glycosyltransferase